MGCTAEHSVWIDSLRAHRFTFARDLVNASQNLRWPSMNGGRELWASRTGFKPPNFTADGLGARLARCGLNLISCFQHGIKGPCDAEKQGHYWFGDLLRAGALRVRGRHSVVDDAMANAAGTSRDGMAACDRRASDRVWRARARRLVRSLRGAGPWNAGPDCTATASGGDGS